MIDLPRAILNRLDRWYHATRLLSWPESRDLRIALLAASGDPVHIEQALDAVETFHPGSAVTLIAPLAWLPASEDELRARHPELRHILAVPPGNLGNTLRPDLALLLHPWPGAAGAAAEAASCRIQKLFARMPARRKWILFRNQELWDGRPKARATRRALNVLRGPVLARIEREELRRLAEWVEPKLEAARAWTGDRLCSHERTVTVFEKPRHEKFCPECGVGFTPPEHAPAQESLMKLYDSGYALSSRYMGRRAFMAYAEGCVGQVNGYLDALEFKDEVAHEDEADPNAAPPAGQKKTVLDYGCGNGRYSLLWTRRGWDYVGVDPSPENIEFAKRFFGSERAPETNEARESIEHEHGHDANSAFDQSAIDHSAFRIPHSAFFAGGLDDDSRLRERGPFGMIFLSHVLEHVPEPLELLVRLRSLAAAGGRLYVEVPNAFRYTWSRQHRGYLSPEHLWDFTPKYLEALAREAGWSEARVLEVAEPNCPYLAMLARNG